MVKGWRNDPLWVKHYAERDSKRLERRITVKKLQAEMAMGAQMSEARWNRRDAARLYEAARWAKARTPYATE